MNSVFNREQPPQKFTIPRFQAFSYTKINSAAYSSIAKISNAQHRYHQLRLLPYHVQFKVYFSKMQPLSSQEFFMNAGNPRSSTDGIANLDAQGGRQKLVFT
jgi:hypothetical protein